MWSPSLTLSDRNSMLIVMKRIRWMVMPGAVLLASWICQIVLLHSLLTLIAPQTVQAAEFYSWIDSNGAVVLTDDLSGLPPALPKTSVWVHRFLDPPPASAVGRGSGRTEPPPNP